MQKFYGFDSTIGVGRNFGFKAGEIKPPLEKPLITSINEDADMAGGVRLEFSQFGSFDSFSVYRSSSTMTLDALPPPIVTGLSQMYYVDPDAAEDMQHFYRVAVTRGEETIVSDEVSIIIESSTGPALTIPTDYVLRYDFNGDLFDRSANLNHGIKNGPSTFDAGRKPDTQSFKFVSGNTLINTSDIVPLASTQVTISFWYYRKIGASQVGYIVSSVKEYGSSSYLSISDSNYGTGLGAETRGIGGSGQNILQTTKDLNDSTWHHVLIELDRDKDAINGIAIYIDNVKQTGSKPASNDFNNPFDSAIMTIGGRYGVGNTLWASLQDIRIYTRMLTISERESLFNE